MADEQQVEQSAIAVGEKRVAIQKFDHEISDTPRLFEEVEADYHPEGWMRKKTVKVYDRHIDPPIHIQTHVFEYDAAGNVTWAESGIIGETIGGPGRVGDGC